MKVGPVTRDSRDTPIGWCHVTSRSGGPISGRDTRDTRDICHALSRCHAQEHIRNGRPNGKWRCVRGLHPGRTGAHLRVGMPARLVGRSEGQHALTGHVQYPQWRGAICSW